MSAMAFHSTNEISFFEFRLRWRNRSRSELDCSTKVLTLWLMHAWWGHRLEITKELLVVEGNAKNTTKQHSESTNLSHSTLQLIQIEKNTHFVLNKVLFFLCAFDCVLIQSFAAAVTHLILHVRLIFNFLIFDKV